MNSSLIFFTVYCEGAILCVHRKGVRALENNNLNQFANLLAGLIAKYIDKLDIEEMPQVSAMEKSEETKDIDVISLCEVKQEERSEK